jgi:hypothetical protein
MVVNPVAKEFAIARFPDFYSNHIVLVYIIILIAAFSVAVNYDGGSSIARYPTEFDNWFGGVSNFQTAHRIVANNTIFNDTLSEPVKENSGSFAAMYFASSKCWHCGFTMNVNAN